MFFNKRNNTHNEAECTKAVFYLKSIFSKPDLVNVFQLDSDESSHDIELAILKVFLNCT
jgi:hypothetical protein